MIKNFCPILSKDLPDEALEEAYPWTAGSACQDYYNINNVSGEELVVDNNWSDLINTAGQQLGYYVYKFNMDRANKLLGEDILADFEEPFLIKGYIDLKDVPRSISQYGGFFSDDELTIYFHIKTFKKLTENIECYGELNLAREPKPGDIIELVNYGCDRPNGRGANLFQITNKEDQLLSDKLNPYFSHYVWRVKAKRYIFSNEGGAIDANGELANEQADDSTNNGTIYPEVEKPEKPYNFSVDEESKQTIFDQRNEGNDQIYGGYYV